MHVEDSYGKKVEYSVQVSDDSAFSIHFSFSDVKLSADLNSVLVRPYISAFRYYEHVRGGKCEHCEVKLNVGSTVRSSIKLLNTYINGFSMLPCTLG